MAIYSELPVYRDSYRLLLEIYKVTNTFSREYKFSLGQDMRRDTLSLFRNLYRANKNQDKRVFLEAFLDDFELLKLQIRVCLDLKLLSYKKMAEIAMITDSIGKQITAWKTAANSSFYADIFMDYRNPPYKMLKLCRNSH